MIARVARFEGVNVASAEAKMEEAEAITRPLIEGLAGYSGHLELIGSEGKMLSITFFETKTDALKAEQTFDVEIPKKLGKLFTGDFAGRRVAVDRYDVVAHEVPAVTM